MLSKNNIKTIVSLQKKKFREELNQFVVEGEKLVLEAIEWSAPTIVHLYFTSEFLFEFPKDISIPHTLISEKELKQISGLQTPNKALVILTPTAKEITSLPFYLALDGVQDPGNMGTLMRLADWYGIQEIICSQETVDCYNPKVIQATMGAIFRVNVRYVDLKEEFQRLNLPVFGALLNGKNVYKEQLSPKGILLLGNEGKGITDALMSSITDPLTIPRFGKAESLNVATAGAILMSEFHRNV